MTASLAPWPLYLPENVIFIQGTGKQHLGTEITNIEKKV